jgi:circadian clock protein KaiB
MTIHSQQPWVLRIYVAGQTAKSATALENLEIIRQKYLPPGASVEVVDILEDNELLVEDHVLAIPTLVRKSPPPLRRIVGTLSDTARVLQGLGLGTGLV